MKKRIWLVRAAKTGQKSQPWQVKIWLPAELTKSLRIKSGDVVRLEKRGRHVTLKKAEIKAKEST